MHRALLALLTVTAASLSATSTLAQTRRPLLGRVIDDRGQAVADAEVHCLMVPLGNERNRALDDLRVQTDARGRFRFQVRPCTRQVLWAIGPADADGRRSASEILWGSAGRLIDVPLGAARAPCKVTLQGLEAWQDHRPFRLRVAVSGFESEGMEFPIDEDDACTLPVLPSNPLQADLLDKHGQPLQSLRIRPKGDTIEAEVHPPQSVPMRVVDAAGKPLAGARIRQRINGGYTGREGYGVGIPSRMVWRELGRTDEHGKLAAKIAERSDPFTKTGWQQLFFVATLDGHNASHCGFRRHPFQDGKEVDPEGLEELTFTLGEAKPIRGRLMHGDRPIADEPLTAYLQIRVQNLKQNSWTHEHYLQRVRTDADGRFAFLGMQGTVDAAQLVLGSDGVLPSMVPEGLRRQLPYRALALHEFMLDAGKELRVDLAACHRVEVQVLDEVGGPASGVEVLLVSKLEGQDATCNEWTPNLTTDSAGRATMLVQAGVWFLFARGETGMVHRELAIDGNQRLDLKLGPMPTMRGRVVDADGKPIANARLNVNSSSWTWAGNDQNRALTVIGSHFNWRWIDDTTTDADGNFACRFLDLEGMSYKGRFEVGKKRSQDFQVAVTEEPITITIE